MKRMSFCPQCGTRLEPDLRFCPNCGGGVGGPNEDELQNELKNWNWGGFFLTWIWGGFNGVWIALLALIPIPLIGLVMSFVLGAKGNVWAWEKGNWRSLEHFRSTQRKWAVWGLVLEIIGIILILPALLVPAIVQIAHENEGGNREESRMTELYNIELAVASVMADPYHPIRSLDGSDKRIAAFTDCGDDLNNPLALTRDMTDGGLITICDTPECVGGNGAPSPLSEYLWEDNHKTDNWYCVQEDGRVEGYTKNCIEKGIDCSGVRIRNSL